MTDWTPQEMMAVAASRNIRHDDTVIVGLGLPQIAALHAKRTHASGATLLLEIGVIQPAPTEASMGIADPRMWNGAQAFGTMLDVLGYLLHGGRVSLGILGALQVDTGGSINSSLIVEEDGTSRRFNGSGGANDIASLAGRTMVVMRHESRKFKERLDFLTSPGRTINGTKRSEAGLPGTGTVVVVTDRAVIEVGEAGLVLASVHAGNDLESVIASTPVQLESSKVVETPVPTAGDIRLIRDELDPLGWYTR